MATTIRTGSFETNSSSTHSLTIMTPADYEGIENGGFYAPEGCDKRLTPGRVYTERELWELGFTDEDIRTDCRWDSLVGQPSDEIIGNDYDYDTRYWDVNHLATPGGEDIVIVCRYGCDD